MSFTINWSDFWPNSRNEMRDDHDLIVATITHNVIGVSGVRISLQRAPNVTWWKGFRLVEANGKEIAGLFGGQDADAPTEHDFTSADMARAARLEIWKAKLLGVHTLTYSLADLTPLQPGTVVELYWAQDTGGIRNADFPMAIFSGVRDQDTQALTFSVNAGTQFQLETRVNNLGSTIAFDPQLDFRIGSQNAQDNMTWGNNRWELGGTVLPNQGRNVTLDLTAPTQPGTYPLALRMVQDGVTWFGNTFQFTATVVGAGGGGGGGGTPGRTCLLTSLTVCLGMLGYAPEKVLDGARLVRAELQKTDAGRELMQAYVTLSETQEIGSLITGDSALLEQCLTLAADIAGQAHQIPSPALLDRLSGSLPLFERIVDTLEAQSSEPTREQLAAVRRLTWEIASG